MVAERPASEVVSDGAPSGRNSQDGSVLLAVAGACDAQRQTVHHVAPQSSTLRGLTIFYPEQNLKTLLTSPIPGRSRGQGDNISLLDVLLVNPYQAVDFGTTAAGRHFISGLYGQPLYRGLFVDQCYDVGRIENVHFWTFWGGWEGELAVFTRARSRGLHYGPDRLGIHDQLLLHRLPHRLSLHRERARPRQLSAHPMRLRHRPDGRAGREQPRARRTLVREWPVHGRRRIAPTNSGPVKFTACGFWGIPTTDTTRSLEGTGHTTFNGCHFIGWGQRDKAAPAILARSGGSRSPAAISWTWQGTDNHRTRAWTPP